MKSETDKCKRDEMYRVKHKYSSALRRWIRGDYPALKYAPMFGASKEYVRQFIEHQMMDRMYWADYGQLWHLDHIVTQCGFDLLDNREVAVCYHFMNIRPLFVHINKGRNSYTDAIRILGNRAKYFPKHKEIIDALIARVKILMKQEPGDIDWSTFEFKEKPQATEYPEDKQ